MTSSPRNKVQLNASLLNTSSNPQNLQMTRLVKYIQNKKSSNYHKLKQLLTKQNPFLDHMMKQKQRQQKSHEKSSSVRVHTDNIFVGNKKAEISSPRALANHSQEKFKLNMMFSEKGQHNKYVITKQQILNLKNKDFDINRNQQKITSNLFPPLSLPKLKPNNQFHRYQEETKMWLNSQPTNCKHKAHTNREKQEKQQEKIFFQLNNRQKYNLSLQKLINKAFKSKVKKQLKQQENSNENSYVSKGKLKSKHHKNKKQARYNKLTNPQEIGKIRDQFKNDERYPIHHMLDRKNDGAINKLKTEILSLNTGSSLLYPQSRTLKLINQSQSMSNDNRGLQYLGSNFVKARHLAKIIDQPYISTDLKDKIQMNQLSSNIKRRPKAKTMQSQQIQNAFKQKAKMKRSIGMWDVQGHQWQQQEQQYITNQIGLQTYVNHISK